MFYPKMYVLTIMTCCSGGSRGFVGIWTNSPRASVHNKIQFGFLAQYRIVLTVE